MNTPSIRQVWIFVSPGSSPLDVVGPFEVFRRANDYCKRCGYQVSLVGARDRDVMTDSGLGLRVHASLAEAMAEGMPHTVLVGGGDPAVPPGSDEAVFADWLREHRRYLPRVCSICTGAFILGEAGLLDGRPATTHWSLLNELRARFPAARVAEDALFTRSKGVWTSAGITVGIDMSLALLENDHGHEVSLAVARFLVLFLRRSGSQLQYTSTLETELSASGKLGMLQSHIMTHMGEELTIEKLAAFCHMSPRNLTRVFKQEVGVTPGRFIRRVRLQEARRLLENTDLAVADIAARVGAGDASTLRRWFIRHLGVSPGKYRDRFAHLGSSHADSAG